MMSVATTWSLGDWRAFDLISPWALCCPCSLFNFFYLCSICLCKSCRGFYAILNGPFMLRWKEKKKLNYCETHFSIFKWSRNGFCVMGIVFREAFSESGQWTGGHNKNHVCVLASSRVILLDNCVGCSWSVVLLSMCKTDEMVLCDMIVD